jgi:GNAT superfamily N-acetyltransferase
MRPGDHLKSRPATIEDIPMVSEIAEKAYSVYITRMGKPPGPMYADYDHDLNTGNLHILMIDEKIVAFAVYELGQREIFIDNLAVHPEFQSKGISAQFVRMLEDWGRENGVFCLRTYTHVLMTENISLYRNVGYKITHRSVENGFDRVYMEKRIVAKQSFPYFFADDQNDNATNLLNALEQLPDLELRWNLAGFRLIEKTSNFAFGWVVVPGHNGWRGARDISLGIDLGKKSLSPLHVSFLELLANANRNYPAESTTKSSGGKGVDGLEISWHRALTKPTVATALVSDCLELIKSESVDRLTHKEFNS